MKSSSRFTFHSSLKKRAAFTLAEVLITLGIIGVVAAMTMPVLVAKYRSLVCTTQLKKMYSVISQAMQMSVPDGDYENIPITDGGKQGALNFFNDYMKKQFSIIKTCYFYETGCWAETVKTKNGNIVKTNVQDKIVFLTKDGFTIHIDTWDSSDYNTISNRYGVNVTGVSPILVLNVDVNGMKRPNVIGKDIFVFVLAEKGLRPAGIDRTSDEINQECKTTGYYCFAKIMRNGWTPAPEDLF